MKSLWAFVIATFIVFCPKIAPAMDTVSLEVYFGSAYNLNMPFEINRDNGYSKSFTGEFDTKAFEEAPYYGVRIGTWEGGKAWEVELIHHKVHLTNTPDEMFFFNVSHGYNLLTINRAIDKGDYILRYGAGLVLSHPEVSWKDMEHVSHDGNFMHFQISGPTVGISAAKRFYVTETMYANVEGKFTASYAKVDFDGGDATVPNVAIHFTVGFGYDHKMAKK